MRLGSECHLWVWIVPRKIGYRDTVSWSCGHMHTACCITRIQPLIGKNNSILARKNLWSPERQNWGYKGTHTEEAFIRFCFWAKQIQSSKRKDAELKQMNISISCMGILFYIKLWLRRRIFCNWEKTILFYKHVWRVFGTKCMLAHVRNQKLIYPTSQGNITSMILLLYVLINR